MRNDIFIPNQQNVTIKITRGELCRLMLAVRRWRMIPAWRAADSDRASSGEIFTTSWKNSSTNTIRHIGRIQDMNNKELIKQQLNAFSGWLGCYIREFEYAAEAASIAEDQIKYERAMTCKRLLEETEELFEMVQENIEDLMDGGDDGERYGIDPYYM